jgi:CIC family chloride channel protein
MHRNSRLDFHNIYSQIISSALTVGMGGSAGLESPSVSSGASIGSNLGRLSGLNYRETTLLLACGGAAGIAGAFNSPFAGMVFAAEVLLPSFSIPAIIPLLIASAFASVVSTLANSEPLFALVPHAWAMHSFGMYVVFGIIAGFYTVYFSWLNEKTHSYFQGLKSIYSKILIGGIGLGILVSLFPAIYGEGYIAIQELLDKNYTSLLANSFFSEYQNSTWILIIFSILTLLGKSWGCSITMGSGGNGGMFGPSVGVGGLLGFIFAYSLNQTGWVDLNITNFLIIGMAASVSGMMHAPMTGIFLAAEITGGYALIVPLMVASAISFFINKRIRKYSIYTRQMAEHGSLIENDNRDTRILNNMNVKMLIEKDFVVLKDSELITNRKKDIVQSERQVFPVINNEGVFIGMLSIEELIQHIVSEDTRQLNQKIGDIVQPVTELVTNDTPLKKVIQLMDTKNTRILPVVDFNKRYLGFITKNGIFKKYRKDLTYYDNILQ